MKLKRRRGILSSILCILAFPPVVVFFPYAAQAQQLEPFVECDEGVIPEPIPMDYGEHTVGCQTDTGPDLDTFVFDGIDGDVTRVIVAGGDFLDPRLEIRDPVGDVIEDTSCVTNGQESCSFEVEMSLVLSGSYGLIVSDVGANDARIYTLQLERVPPLSPLVIEYNSNIVDEINPGTDVDFLAFGGAVGDDVRVTVSGADFLDPRLQVLDPNGMEIASDSCNTNGQEACSFAVDFSVSLVGFYVLILSELGHNDSRGYELNLQCLFGLCTNPVTEIFSDGFESGDT